MKIKDLEGSPEELNNFFHNNGLNLTDYLNINSEKRADKLWIYILVPLFIICNITICQFEQSHKFFIPITIITLGVLGGLVAIIQLNYEKSIVSTIVAIAGLLIMVVSFKILSPKETIKIVKDKSEKYLETHSESKK
jgi:FtsH-binding integral membrane protein